MWDHVDTMTSNNKNLITQSQTNLTGQKVHEGAKIDVPTRMQKKQKKEKIHVSFVWRKKNCSMNIHFHSLSHKFNTCWLAGLPVTLIAHLQHFFHAV